MLDHALAYAARGWRVHPLRARDKTPASKHGCKDATTDEAQIKAWWTKLPNANIGLATGYEFFVIDIDPAGMAWYEAEQLPATHEAVTGRAGRHVLYRMPAGYVIGNTAGLLAKGVDVRGIGGYIVAPPSLHPSGTVYQWLDCDGLVPDGPCADAPPEIIAALAHRPETSGPLTIPNTIKKGVQHRTLHALASSLRAKGMEQPEIEAALIIAARRCEDVPPDSHMARLAESVCKLYKPGLSPDYAARARQPVAAPADDDEGDDFDDERGLIPSLVDAIAKRHHFAKDAGGRLFIYARGVYRQGAEDIIRTEVRDLLEKWRQLPKWKSALGDEACAYIRINHTPDLDEIPSFDRINCLNGLVEIRTGKLLPHTPEYRSPVQLPITYDPAAKCPAWQSFLGSTLPKDFHPLIWQLIGWLITPDVSEQKAVLFVGAGGNGKSVLIDAIIALLGRQNISAKTLHQLEDDRFAAADLVGKLANVCADLPANLVVGSNMFKAIVGGDAIDAQRKHKDPFTFRPYARLLFSANAYPRSNDGTDGFFRRWLVIPFERSFEGSERRSKRELDEQLQSPSELSGALNMALIALGHLRLKGFDIPQKVAESSASFREATDPVAAWLDKRTKKDAEGRVGTKELLFAFNEEVSRPNGLAFLTQHALTKALKQRGIEKKESSDYYYAGIVLELRLETNP